MTVPLPEIPLFPFPKKIFVASLPYTFYPYPPGNRLKADFNLCGLYPFMLQYKNPACRWGTVDGKAYYISRNTTEMKSFGSTRRKTPFFINQIRPPIDPISFTSATQFYKPHVRACHGSFPYQQNILSELFCRVFNLYCCQCFFITDNSHIQPGKDNPIQEYTH